jgi:hypothetical protein
MIITNHPNNPISHAQELDQIGTWAAIELNREFGDYAKQVGVDPTNAKCLVSKEKAYDTGVAYYEIRILTPKSPILGEAAQVKSAELEHLVKRFLNPTAMILSQQGPIVPIPRPVPLLLPPPPREALPSRPSWVENLLRDRRSDFSPAATPMPAAPSATDPAANEDQDEEGIETPSIRMNWEDWLEREKQLKRMRDHPQWRMSQLPFSEGRKRFPELPDPAIKRLQSLPKREETRRDSSQMGSSLRAHRNWLAATTAAAAAAAAARRFRL